jgi:hypothetical protein
MRDGKENCLGIRGEKGTPLINPRSHVLFKNLIGPQLIAQCQPPDDQDRSVQFRDPVE